MCSFELQILQILLMDGWKTKKTKKNDQRARILIPKYHFEVY